LTELAANFPRTPYSLKKKLDIKSDLTQFCVCPTCHTLYKEKDCPCKCDHVEFPDHPHALYEQKCGTDLMKTIRVEKTISWYLKKLMFTIVLQVHFKSLCHILRFLKAVKFGEK